MKENQDFYFPETDLTFHKINCNKLSNDDCEIVSIINSWRSPEIFKYLLCEDKSAVLGSLYLYMARENKKHNNPCDFYCVFDGNSQEVIGTALLAPNSHLNEVALERTSNFLIRNRNMRKSPAPLSYTDALRLLKSPSDGLFIMGFGVDPEKTGQGIGTQVIRTIDANLAFFNNNKSPSFNMCNIEMGNTASKSIFYKENYKEFADRFWNNDFSTFYRINE